MSGVIFLKESGLRYLSSAETANRSQLKNKPSIRKMEDITEWATEMKIISSPFGNILLVQFSFIMLTFSDVFDGILRIRCFGVRAVKSTPSTEPFVAFS